MRVVLASAARPSHFDNLRDCGAQDVLLSYHELRDPELLRLAIEGANLIVRSHHAMGSKERARIEVLRRADQCE